MVIKQGLLYLYGGVFEDRDDRQITFNDFYSIGRFLNPTLSLADVMISVTRIQSGFQLKSAIFKLAERVTEKLAYFESKFVCQDFYKKPNLTTHGYVMVKYSTLIGCSKSHGYF